MPTRTLTFDIFDDRTKVCYNGHLFSIGDLRGIVVELRHLIGVKNIIREYIDIAGVSTEPECYFSQCMLTLS